MLQVLGPSAAAAATDNVFKIVAAGAAAAVAVAFDMEVVTNKAQTAQAVAAGDTACGVCFGVA